MYRVLFFLALLVLPICWSWWLFIPLSIVLVYLAKTPYEVLVVGAVLDSLYYLGNDWFSRHALLLFALLLLLTAFFLNGRIVWKKVI